MLLSGGNAAIEVLACVLYHADQFKLIITEPPSTLTYHQTWDLCGFRTRLTAHPLLCWSFHLASSLQSVPLAAPFPRHSRSTQSQFSLQLTAWLLCERIIAKINRLCILQAFFAAPSLAPKLNFTIENWQKISSDASEISDCPRPQTGPTPKFNEWMLRFYLVLWQIQLLPWFY